MLLLDWLLGEWVREWNSIEPRKNHNNVISLEESLFTPVICQLLRASSLSQHTPLASYQRLTTISINFNDRRKRKITKVLVLPTLHDCTFFSCFCAFCSHFYYSLSFEVLVFTSNTAHSTFTITIFNFCKLCELFFVFLHFCPMLLVVVGLTSVSH